MTYFILGVITGLLLAVFDTLVHPKELVHKLVQTNKTGAIIETKDPFEL